MAKCKDCGQPILWMENEGRKIPVDPVEVGFVEDQNGIRAIAISDMETVKGRVVGDASEEGYELAHLYHCDTCPNGKENYK